MYPARTFWTHTVVWIALDGNIYTLFGKKLYHLEPGTAFKKSQRQQGVSCQYKCERFQRNPSHLVADNASGGFQEVTLDYFWITLKSTLQNPEGFFNYSLGSMTLYLMYTSILWILYYTSLHHNNVLICSWSECHLITP